MLRNILALPADPIIRPTGAEFRAARQALGIDQQAFALHAGVDRVTVWRWEQSAQVPRRAVTALYSAAAKAREDAYAFADALRPFAMAS